ncbi:Polynucleotide 5'-hydroxyl-kinase grc3 [Arachnomyces sp. PD_36]|nr:Polynucleotide 5'-hydroxyl-kinase grc3 [Arachnomyces sp. PD_36]
MKRKGEAQQPAGPISAVAARRSRQQARQPAPEATTVPAHTFSGDEPPSKKSKPSPRRPARRTNNSNGTTSNNPPPTRRKSPDLESSPSSPVAESAVQAELEATEETGGYDNPNEDEEEQPYNGANDIYELPPEEPVQYQDFQLSRILFGKGNVVYNTEEALCVRMKLRTTLVLIGTYDLWVKRGVVSIMGAKLHASPTSYRIYAPSTHSLPVIKSVAGMDDYAEVEIRSCSNDLYRLKHLSSLYHRIWNSKNTVTDKDPLVGCGGRSFSVMNLSSDDPLGRPLRPLHLEKKWSASIKALAKRGGRLRVLTCGPKGAGKSTFNRYLLNHLLSPPPQPDTPHTGRDGVAFLDLDPGQPEFSPMGQVYLSHLRQPNFGPPFSHPTLNDSTDGEIFRAHHIGAISPKDDPDHYSMCAMDLMDSYWKLLESHPQCPLIVNFPGWIFGQGLEIVIWLIKSLGLSDVVYMSEKGPAEVVEPLQYAANETNIPLTTLPSQPTDFVTRSSYEQRTMQIMSYFHMGRYIDNPSWSELPIYQNRPLTVNYDGPNQGILGIMVMGCRQNTDLLSEILDGSIVALVAVEDYSALGPTYLEEQSKADGFENEADDEDTPMNGDDTSDIPMPTPPAQPQQDELHPGITRTKKENLPYIFLGNGSCTPLDPKSSHSLGLAIVRSIDTASHKLELITPIPRSTLRETLEQGQKIALVIGQLDNPNWALGEEYFAAQAAERRHRKEVMRLKASGEEMDAEVREQQEKRGAMLRDRVHRAGNGPWRRMVEGRGDDRVGQRKGARVWKLRKKAVPLDSVETGTEAERGW